MCPGTLSTARKCQLPLGRLLSAEAGFSAIFFDVFLWRGDILRNSFGFVLSSLLLIVPLFAGAAEQNLEARRAELNRLLADEWEYTLRTQPELATHIGDNRYNDRLSDYSDKAIADDLEHSRQSLRRFEAIDTSGFPESEKLNQALMVRSLRDGIDEARFKNWEMPATQFGGIHLEYASLPFDSPFRNAKDYEDYLSRLRQIPRVLEQAMGHMRDGLRDRLMPPKYLLEKVSVQAQGIADSALDKSPFTDPLRKFPPRFGDLSDARIPGDDELAHSLRRFLEIRRIHRKHLPTRYLLPE